MVMQAVADLPNECCGLLAGRIVELVSGFSGDFMRIGVVERRYPLTNELASPAEYLSRPPEMFEACRSLRQLEIEVLAVYHSHPLTEPVPSRKDLEWNYSKEVMN